MTDLALLDELSNVFHDEPDAKLLLESIGFPLGRQPAFRTARRFWTMALREIERGIAPSLSLATLAAAALERYPGNKTFQSFTSEITPPAPLAVDRPKLDVDRPEVDIDRRLKVFLCHANEDKPKVQQIGAKLRADGFVPWIDIENLLPGQNWREETTRVVRQTDAFIVFVSSRSVVKTGFVQKEIRLALDVLDEQPPGAIFLIPVRLDDVEVPGRLSDLAYVDLFGDGAYADGAYDRLRQALNAIAKRLKLKTGPRADVPTDRSTKRPAKDQLRAQRSTLNRRVARKSEHLGQALGGAQPVVGQNQTSDVGLSGLEDAERECFFALAVFPEDTDIPLHILKRFWGLSKTETRELCKRLQGLALVQRDEDAFKTIRLRDLGRQQLTNRQDDPAALHRQLLERCQPSTGRWSDLKTIETYLWRHLATHLKAARDEPTLRALLHDFDYLEGKLRKFGVNALLSDYDVLDDEGARTIQEALRLSAHVLSRKWGSLLGQQLAGQLLGRLETTDEAGLLLLQAAASRSALQPQRVRMSRTGGPLIRTLEGHKGRLHSVAVLDEGRVIAASSEDSLHVWDVESGEKTLRTLKAHRSYFTTVTVLDEAHVVSASDDHVIRVWDIESGETLHALKGHTDRVTAVAVLDEDRVISASHDQTLRVWDLESGETLHTLEGHTDWVTAVAMLEEGRVISASKDRTLRVWDLESGEVLRTLAGHTLWVTAVVVLDKGRVISASLDDTLRVWDVESTKTLARLEGHTDGVTAVAVLDEGRVVVSASHDKTLRVWDVESAETLHTLEGHTGWVSAVTVLDKGHVVSASHDKTLRVWNVESGETLPAPEGHTEGVHAVAVLGDRVISASRDKTLKVWDIDSGEILETLKGHTSSVTAVAAVDEGRMISASIDHTLRVWDLESGQTLGTLEGHTDKVNAVAMLDAGRVISASSDHTLRVWDVDSGETLGTLIGHRYGVNAVAVLDKNRVVSASNDSSLRMWDVESGQTLRTLGGHNFGVIALAALDEGRVVSASRDKTLRVWDVDSGETLRTLIGHTSFVTAVAVLDDGRVVSASLDHTLRIWDVESGQATGIFALECDLWAVASAPKLVIAGDVAGGVHFLTYR